MVRKTPLFDLPSWVPLEPWNEWLAMRAKKRAPNTPYALSLAVKHLADLQRQGFTPQAILDNCIMCGWVGIFPPRIGNLRGRLPTAQQLGSEPLDEQDKLDLFRQTGVWPQ